MGAAEVIAFEEVRARKQWDTLRQQLHARFDHWLDTLEQQWHEPPSPLMEVTATVWALRQQLTGALTETIVAHVHRGEHDRQQLPCPRCGEVLKARELVCRTGRRLPTVHRGSIFHQATVGVVGAFPPVERGLRVARQGVLAQERE